MGNALRITEQLNGESIVSAARDYAKKGYCPIPCKKGKKVAKGDAWQKQRIQPHEVEDHFTENCGIGLLLGAPSGLVDADLDCEASVALARFFLPKTGMIHGRSGKHASHYWYRPTTLGKTKRFPGVGRTTMVAEVRSTGAQTIVPPSVHPETQAPYSWDQYGEPTEIDFLELTECVAKLSAAALLAEHWPTSGRHCASLAVSGALARAGWHEDEIANFTTAIASYVNGDDGEPAKRQQQAADSIAKIENGESHCTGFPSLEKEHGIPSEVIQKVRKWLSIKPELGQSGGKPTISLSSDLRQMADAAENALLEIGGLYVRAQDVVEIVEDQSRGRVDSEPRINRVSADRMRELLGESANWQTINEKGNIKYVKPPVDVVKTLLARGQWKFPYLETVVDAPILRLDGTVASAPGYDEETRTYVATHGRNFPQIPENPTKAEAQAALNQLLEPLCDFPFTAESDRAAAIAFILTMLGRQGFHGCAPMFGVGAPIPGSGKGLLVEACVGIGSGSGVVKMVQTKNDEEFRKRLLALALQSPQVIFIDNVEGSFGSPVLAMALTTGEVSDRLLGSSMIATASLQSTWVYTGNNVGLQGDLGRRVVPIDLAPQLEHPEDRQGFKFPQLLCYVHDNRARLVVAGLTVLRAFIVAGSPRHPFPPKGSYEGWDRLIRGTVYWVTDTDPLLGTERIRESGDEDKAELDRLLKVFGDLYGQEGEVLAVVTSQMGQCAPFSDEPRDQKLLELKDALLAMMPSKTDISPTTIGRVFKKAKGRIVGGRRLETGSKTRAGVRWSVVELKGGARQ